MNGLLETIHSRLNAPKLADNLTALFCETLRWARPAGPQRPLTVGQPVGCTLTAVPVARISGLPVFRVDWPQERLPGVTARRAVHRALAQTHVEHLLCYVTCDAREAAFVWARRRPDGKIELRTLPYEVGSPARTTIERLGELAFSLDELAHGEPPITAVADKLNRAFDVEAVTKQFYQELANWFFWASDHVTFPMPKGTPNPDAYKAQSLIRLITRLIFCWFVKQKRLIPEDLFDPTRLATLLKQGSRLATSKDTVFYKAILQNLFFATFNQEMDKRAFRKRNPQGRDPHHGITNLYRYEDYFTNPRAFLDLTRRIPFLNGGLFECLDKVYRADENRPDERIDGFSDHPKNPLRVPDCLFFGEEREVDLSAAYGEARYRRARVRGLIHLFNRYNFTVTENTPLDQEVALDPELAGKVFENLLAAYNPETATTARKATGSYYTPRPIVDYMVDEALIAYLNTRLSGPSDPSDLHEQRLRHLLAYNDEPHQFTPAEVKTLIEAIDNLKALDPACGSGAFPMGLLHKLVFILGKLDPHNAQWKQRQIAKANEIPDATVREKALADIEQAFAANELDYGRKLYLIENCIYGVDIQPIAVQIAKMRFFISLIVDQRVDDAKPNRGILSLPNLETKFVAANTLIGIEKPAQQMLRNPQIDAKEAELRRVRERHFTARTPATKARCREQDAKLRAEISELLRADGFPRETTQKLANWNPYDQNASADFFDPEWMFGIKDGFDIVIGNPPYGIDLGAELKMSLDARFSRHKCSTKNSAIYFIYVADELLKPKGSNAFIVPKSLCYSAGWRPCANFLLKELRRLVDMGKAFENVLLEQVVFVRNKQNTCASFTNGLFEAGKILEMAEVDKSFFEKSKVLLAGQTREELGLITRITASCPLTLGDLVDFERGLNWQSKVARHRGKTPIYRGAQLDKWVLHDATDFVNLSAFDEQEYSYQLRPKILNQLAIAHVQNPRPHFYLQAALDEKGNVLVFETISCTFPKSPRVNLRFILGLNNSTLFAWLLYKLIYSNAIRSTRYDGEYVGRVPIPDVPADQQAPIVKLVDKILAAKQTDPLADVSAWEREIDERVYRLYGLTPEEIKIVEEGVK